MESSIISSISDKDSDKSFYQETSFSIETVVSDN